VSRAYEHVETTEKNATVAFRVHNKKLDVTTREKTVRKKAESDCDLLKKKNDKLKKELSLKDSKITELEEDASSGLVLYTKALNKIHELKARVPNLEIDLQTNQTSAEDMMKKVINEYCKSQDFDDLVYEEARSGYKLGYSAAIKSITSRVPNLTRVFLWRGCLKQFRDIGISPVEATFFREEHSNFPDIAED
ncbi:hypothetical protein Dimus_020589, partial [Dionaea muscipula]